MFLKTESMLTHWLPVHDIFVVAVWR